MVKRLERHEQVSFPQRAESIAQNRQGVCNTLATDRFEAAETNLAFKSPQLIQDIEWWAKFLLEQQKCANLQIAKANEEMIDTLNSSEVSQFLTKYKELKSDLQQFEKLKLWENPSKTVRLKSNEDFLISLLKLLLNKEDVHLIEWLNVKSEVYENYLKKMSTVQEKLTANKCKLEEEQTKIAALKAQLKKTSTAKELPLIKSRLAHCEEDITKQVKLDKIDQLHFEIMQKKVKIFEYVFTSNQNQTPLCQFQTIMQNLIAPQIHRAKSWIIFGKRCLHLATDLTHSGKQFYNSTSAKERKELEHTLKEIFVLIQQEFEKNHKFITAAKPILKDLS